MKHLSIGELHAIDHEVVKAQAFTNMIHAQDATDYAALGFAHVETWAIA